MYNNNINNLFIFLFLIKVASKSIDRFISIELCRI